MTGRPRRGVRGVAALTAGAVLVFLAGCGDNDHPTEAGGEVSYAAMVQPVFDHNCLSGCHRTAGLASFLDLTADRSWAQLVNVRAVYSAGVRVVPGDPAASVLWKRVNGGTAGSQMPLGTSPLRPIDQALIRIWIAEGAKDN